MSQIEVPKGWVLKPLKEIADVTRGISWSKNDEYKKFENGTIPVIRIGNVRDRNLDLTNLIYIKNLSVEQFQKNKASKNDLLLVGSNGNRSLVGRSCKITEDMDFVFASFLMCIKNLSSEIDSDFLLNYINSPQGKYFLSNSTSTSVGINNLKITQLREMPIIYPKDKNIQKNIVKKINEVFFQYDQKKDSIFNTLENQIILIKKYKIKIINSIFDAACFGRFTLSWREINSKSVISLDLKETIEKKFSNVPIIPKNWIWSSLYSCCKISDGTHNPPPGIESGIPLLFVANIVNGYLDFNVRKYVSQKSYEELHKKSPVEFGDVLYSTVGSYGHSVLVNTDKKFTFQRHIALLKPQKHIIIPEYLHYFMKTQFVFSQTEKSVRGIAQKTLNLGDLRKFMIVIPPLDEQKEIVKIVSKKMETVIHLKNYLNSIMSKKKDMKNNLKEIPPQILNEAFSGRLVN